MKLIITCEVKQTSNSSRISGLKVPWDADSEHLSEVALTEIRSALSVLGHDVIVVQEHEELIGLGRRQDDVLCINLSVGYGGPSTKVFTAALLDILGIPYVGSPPHALAITRDKSISKATAQWLRIRTPWWFVAYNALNLSSEIDFPVIVKPLHESSSIGIQATSVVYGAEQLRKAISRVLSLYRQPAIVEQYVPGVDVEVPFIGETDILGFVGVIPRITPMGSDILTSGAVYKDAYDFTDARRLAKWSAETEAEVRWWVCAFAQATGMRDYGRVDFRMDHNGDMYFIEASTHPYLALHSSFTWIYEQSGRKYSEFWEDLIRRCHYNSAENFARHNKALHAAL